jgi:hypothetical protein
MAMLYLWHKFIKQNALQCDSGYEVFLVDHKARQGSSDEAERVAHQVRQLTGKSIRTSKDQI